MALLIAAYEVYGLAALVGVPLGVVVVFGRVFKVFALLDLDIIERHGTSGHAVNSQAVHRVLRSKKVATPARLASRRASSIRDLLQRMHQESSDRNCASRRQVAPAPGSDAAAPSAESSQQSAPARRASIEVGPGGFRCG